MNKLNVGKIVGTHGIKGELKINSNTDFPDLRFKVKNKLYLDIDNQEIEFTIKTHRVHKNLDLVSFDGLQDINLVEKYKGMDVFAYVGADDLQNDEHYYFEIIGCKVITTDNREVGIITSIIEGVTHDILVVSNKGKKDTLIPYVEAFIIDQDFDAKVLTLNEIEGLINEN